MNDWEMKRLAIVVTSIQLAVWGFWGWEWIGLRIDPMMQVIGFIYVCYVPGILIMRVMKIHNIDSIRTVMYAVGLSITATMITLLTINTTLPLLQVSTPLSTVPVFAAMNGLVLVLLVAAYIVDRDSIISPEFINVNRRSVLISMAFVLIILTTIAGTYAFNFKSANTVLIAVLILISFLPVLVTFGKSLSPYVYPLAIVCASVALLLHSSLTTSYLIGWDIQYEYFLANGVVNHSLWDTSGASTSSGMLSVVLLAPALSYFCHMDLMWVFKIIYPLLFSLVPLGLFYVYRKFTKESIAFLSAFLFLSMVVFYTDMVQLAKQQIAELFMVLLMIVIFVRRDYGMNRPLLLILFSFSLTVSHYGLTYFYIALLVVSLMAMHFIDRNQKREEPCVSWRYAAFCVVLALVWYVYISSSSSFHTIIEVMKTTLEASFNDFLNPGTAQGLAFAYKNYDTPLLNVLKYLQLIVQFLIVVGFLSGLSRENRKNTGLLYVSFAGTSLAIMAAGIVLPYFASSLETGRLYHIGLLLLSPFCITGAYALARGLSRLKGVGVRNTHIDTAKVMSVFLAVYLIFNAGVDQEIAGEPQSSVSLDTKGDYARFNLQEVTAARWLVQLKGESQITADAYRWLLIGAFAWGEMTSFPTNISSTSYDTYIYLGTYNVQTREILVIGGTEVLHYSEYIHYSEALGKRNEILDVGGANVYYG